MRYSRHWSSGKTDGKTRTLARFQMNRNLVKHADVEQRFHFRSTSPDFLCVSVWFPQEVWACWCELLSYLEQENAFLDQLEQKLDDVENLQGGAEKLQEALDVSITRPHTNCLCKSNISFVFHRIQFKNS